MQTASGRVGAGLAASFQILTLIVFLLVPSLTPQDLKLEYHKNDFPDQRREPGFRAYVPWMHNNSVMSRLICSSLKIYIVSTALFGPNRESKLDCV